MPTRPDDRMALLIGGRRHADWESYECDSDLMTPADAWRVTLGLEDGRLPSEVTPGAPVEVRIGGDPVMVGLVDEIGHAVARDTHQLTLSGRDGAAVLVDCSAPIFVARMADLDEIVAKVVRPLGVRDVTIAAAATRRREKINVEPGDTAWNVLSHACEANGLWPWFTPSGTLVIGGPDYDAPVVATLVLRRDGRGNNVERLEQRRSLHGRHSHLTVLGQTHGTAHETGKHALSATERDLGLDAYRPRVVVDHECDSAAVARDRARKLIADARLSAFELAATVKGHRIAEGAPGAGKLWEPGQRVHLVSEPHGLAADYFLMARKFTGGRSQAPRTELTLKEDRMWVLDAHPHKRKHRRGRNGIMDDYTGPRK